METRLAFAQRATKGKVGYGHIWRQQITRIRIAGWNHGGLGHDGYGVDQQLLQATGSECNSVHRTRAAHQWIADGITELSATGSSWCGHFNRSWAIEGRYAKPRRGEILAEPMFEIVWAFSLPGRWTGIESKFCGLRSQYRELTLP